MVYQAVNNRTGNKNWKIGHCNPPPQKIGEKQDLPQENNLFSPTFIYLIGYKAVKRVKKMDSIMIWSKSNVSGNNCQHQRNVKFFNAEQIRQPIHQPLISWD